MGMIAFIVIVVIAILVLGLVLKLAKLAILLAIGAGVVLLAKKHFGNKRLK
jgi:hypothetical protein